MPRSIHPLPLIMFVSLLMSHALSTPPARAETLRRKLSPGQKFQQTMVQDMQTSAPVGEETIQNNISQTMDAQWVVQGVDNQGNAQVSQKIRRIRVTIAGPAGQATTIDTDSDAKPEGPAALLAAPLKAMAQSEFVLKMTPQGEIVDVQVADTTLQALQSLPGAEQMGPMFSKDGLVDMIKQATPKLPAGDVQAGHSWTSKLENKVPQLGSMLVTSELTYRGPETVSGKELQRIDLKFNTQVAAAENPLVKMTIGEQRAEGKMYFDNEAGFLRSSEVTQNMVLRLTFGGMTIDQRIAQTTQVTLKPLP